MAVTIRAQAGDIGGAVRAAERDLKIAMKAAVAGATQYALGKMRESIRARTTSTRLPNILGAKVFPEGSRIAREPAGSIFARGKKANVILKQMIDGATITVRRRKALAIPLHNIRDSNGTLLPPAAFPNLVYIPSKRRPTSTLGILAYRTTRTKRGFIRAAERRRQAAVSRSRVQPGLGEDFTAMFVLVRTVRIPKTFDPEAIMQDASRQFAPLFQRALAATESGSAAGSTRAAGSSGLRPGSMAERIFSDAAAQRGV